MGPLSGLHFPQSTTSPPLILSRILPRHLALIPRSLTTFPEPASGFLYKTRTTDAALFRPIVLLPRAITADHPVSMLIRMVACGVMAFVACKDFRAAAETEPAVAFAVVLTAAAPGEFFSCDYAERFLWLCWKWSVSIHLTWTRFRKYLFADWSTSYARR